MADGAAPEVDITQLTASQQEALQQYTDVTSQDVSEAIAVLQRSQWNVQIAITKFFDGEGQDPVAEAISAQQNTVQPGPGARFDTLVGDGPMGMTFDDIRDMAANPQNYEPHTRRAGRTPVAPRVVPPQPTTYRPPYLLSIIFAPFRAGYGLLTLLFRSVSYILSFLPRQFQFRAVGNTIGAGLKNTNGRRMLMPKDTAARFKREFDEQYGENSLTWFDGGHAQALDAAKKDVKFLLIILISPEHDDTDSFVKGTLLSQEVVDFVNDPANNIILWGGNVMDSEAYQVSLEYNCTKFPCSVLACLTPKEGATRMGIIKRVAGPTTPSRYLASLKSAMAKYTPDLEGVRAERVANDFARNLRAEQDAAYERSLATDRERARQRREAEEAAAAEERRIRAEAEAAERREQKRQQWRKWRATTVAPEPEASVKDAVRLALNMPEGFGGGRVVRRFGKETTLEELYAFVECYPIISGAESQDADDDEKAAQPEDYTHKYDFRIALMMPRETLYPEEGVTIAEKVGRGGNLIVEDIPHYESDEE
ncbi:hypothetical protein GE09DRAFT_1114435 [Coniochaeta sp. 2T2.1]|nr:hypothetical protein GE09DRAFT_1114435 [Coniochaeta sp. 2T2.1]